MSVGGLLNKTCSIRRGIPAVSSTTGGPLYSFSGDDPTASCAVQVRNQDDRQFGSRETGVAEYNVYFPIGTDVRNGDMLHTITGMTNVVLKVNGQATEGVGRSTYLKVVAESKQGFKVG